MLSLQSTSWCSQGSEEVSFFLWNNLPADTRQSVSTKGSLVRLWWPVQWLDQLKQTSADDIIRHVCGTVSPLHLRVSSLQDAPQQAPPRLVVLSIHRNDCEVTTTQNTISDQISSQGKNNIVLLHKELNPDQQERSVSVFLRMFEVWKLKTQTRWLIICPFFSRVGMFPHQSENENQLANHQWLYTS